VALDDAMSAMERSTRAIPAAKICVSWLAIPVLLASLENAAKALFVFVGTARYDWRTARACLDRQLSETE
jgi:hypothetical protein